MATDTLRRFVKSPAYWLATIFFIVSFYMNFLSGEDATILFNRVNHLESSFFTFYNGYISGLPQIIAKIVSPLPPILQALLYALSAFTLFTLMLVYIEKITNSRLVSLCLVIYLTLFGRNYFFNLTYSLWTSLSLIGLIGVYSIIKDRKLKIYEFFIVVACATSSPLSFCMIFVYIYKIYRNRSDIRSYIIIPVLIIMPIILSDQSSDRGNVIFLLNNLLQAIILVFKSPGIFFNISSENSLISPAQLTRLGSTLAVLIIIAYAIYQKFKSSKLSTKIKAVQVFCVSSLAIYGLSIAVKANITPELLFLGERYWFVLIIAAVISLPVVFSNFFHRFGYYGLIPLAFLLIILSGLINLERFLECSNCSQDVLVLLKGHSINQTIERPGRENRTSWSIALGEYFFKKSDCISQDNDSKLKFDFDQTGENYDFSVHCSGSYTISYTKDSQTEYNEKDNRQQEKWGSNVWNNLQRTNNRGADLIVSNAVLLKSMLKRIQTKI